LYARISGIGEGDLFLIAQPTAAEYDFPMKNLATILCVSTVLLFSPTAKAWSGAGHQVIAQWHPRSMIPASSVPGTSPMTMNLKTRPQG
jgi:hypothetical protein